MLKFSPIWPVKILSSQFCGFLCPSDMISLIFEHVVTFWHNKTSHVHLVLSLPQIWKQPRLEYYLETKIWDTHSVIFGHSHQTVCPTTLQDIVLCILPKACFPTHFHPCLSIPTATTHLSPQVWFPQNPLYKPPCLQPLNPQIHWNVTFTTW